MTNPLEPRVRRLAPKTRTGCTTCKKRRVKCDERQPTCLRCENLDIKCDGYEVPKAWVFEPRSLSPQLKEKVGKLDQEAGNAKPTPTPEHPQELLSKSTITPCERPNLYALIPIKDSEDLLLMQTYLQFTAKFPVAWDSDLYPPKQNLGPAEMTDKDTLILHANSPVTRAAHLAMATATLHLFHPKIFPSQLQLKYLHLAIVKVRTLMFKRNFEVTDLLHAISKIFLASVLLGDEVAARAHLKAAKELVDQRGGLDAIYPPTARALKYGDLHLAVETVSPPIFLVTPDAEPPDRGDLVGEADSAVLRLSQWIHKSAAYERRSVSEPLVRSYCNFAKCAVALAHAWSDGPGCIDLGKLGWIATTCLATFNVLLRMSSSKTVILTAVQEDARHTLILWIQLLCYMGNDSVTKADVRSNTITISNNVLSHGLSPTVRYGLTQWNHIVSMAEICPHDHDNTAMEDLLQLIRVVSDMEADQPVRVGPLMMRLWKLKKDYRGMGLTPRAAVDAMQRPNPGIIFEED